MGKDSFIPFLNFLQEHVASGLCPGVAVPPSATSLVSSDHVQGGGARSVRDREEAWRGEARRPVGEEAWAHDAAR